MSEHCDECRTVDYSKVTTEEDVDNRMKELEYLLEMTFKQKLRAFILGYGSLLDFRAYDKDREARQFDWVMNGEKRK